METVSCDHCHGTALKDLPTLTASLSLPAPYRIVACQRCGLRFMNPRMTVEEYKEFYSSKYYEDYGYDELLAERRVPEFRRTLKLLDRYKPTKGKLLDVGTASGEFLREAKQQGWAVSGTEISRFSVRTAKEKYGLDVFEGELHEAPFPEKSFDVIQMSHVLEHVPSPTESLRTIGRFLKDDGIAVIEVPNEFDNWFLRLGKLLGRYKAPAEPSMHHVFFFTPSSLKTVMQGAGFSPEVSTYSLDIPYSGMPTPVRPMMAGLTRCVDRLGGGVYIQAFARKAS